MPLNSSRYLFIIVVFVLTGCNGSNGMSPETSTGIAGDGGLSKILELIRQETRVPALAALSVKEGAIVEMALVGTTTIDGSEAVSLDSKWHLGSLTKSMTSVLAGIFVEKGLIGWNSTLLEIMPDLAPSMLEKYHDIRLEELLSHTSGIDEADWELYYGNTDALTEQHTQLLLETLSRDYEQVERGAFWYSNSGYVIAAAMLEKIGSMPWETLISQELFEPLEMSNTAFMAPKDSGSPWGHVPDDATPMNPHDPQSDLPAVLAPAGLVHTTLRDMALYIDFHLDRGSSLTLLASSTFDKLYTEVGDSGYGMGWNTVTGSDIVFHEGSNGMWLANLTLYHGNDIGLFIVTNIGASPTDDRAGEALERVTYKLLERLTALNDK